MRYVLLFCCSLILSCMAHTASAQTVVKSPGRLRAENRRALRETKKYEAEYKDSHLAVNRDDLRRSQGRELPHDGRRRLQFDHTGTPKVSEPSRVNLRLGKRRKN
jgi:hypothetical protein